MFASRSEAIYELLRDEVRVDPGRLADLMLESRTTGQPLADAAIEHGLVEKPVLLARIAGHLGCPFIADPPGELATEIVKLLPAALARAYGVIPLRAGGQGLELIAADPFDSQAAGELSFVLGRDVRLAVCDPAQVDRLLRQHYSPGALPEEASKQTPNITGSTGTDDGPSVPELEAMAGQAPVVRFVNLVLAQAIRAQASDVHFEPFEREFKIRCRVDGVLQEMAPPPRALALPITSRIKVLANLDIAERRVPQDGRIRITLGGRPVDLRVSTLPTQYGESVVLRILDRSAVQLELAGLGMPGDVLNAVQQIVRRPNGILLVTGPTGSGKTTTLYSALREITAPSLKLLTIEDPVEYEIEGVMQVPINPAAGLTFASALRAFLRQDPDVIMVGEIRDLETAQIAIQASLTGHLVLSTLHTNDAPGALTRLLDMGVEPFLAASTVEGVLSQRLVRRICPDCRAPDDPPPALLAQLGLASDPGGGRQFFCGRGCAQCGGTGYRGRTGIFEWLVLTEPLRELVAQKAPAFVIQQKARELGMRSLREDGLRAACSGATTLEEICRCL